MAGYNSMNFDEAFWDKLQRLESRHQREQSQHELLRRQLDVTATHNAEEFSAVWKRYCDVIAELDRTAADFETLRTQVG